MRNPIKQSNQWYDNLPKLKRDLFFLIFIFGSLLVAQVLTYVEVVEMPSYGYDYYDSYYDPYYVSPIWLVPVLLW